MVPDEKVRILNTQAHLDSLLGELSVVNALLTEILASKAVAEQELAATRAALASVQAEFVDTHNRLQNLTFAGMDVEEETQKKLETVRQERLDFAQFFTERMAEIRSAELASERLVADNLASLENINVSIEEARGQLAPLSAQVLNLNETIKLLNSEKIAVEERITAAHNEYLSDVNRIDAAIEEKNEELAEATKLVLEEKAKIDMPMKLLAQREEEMDKRDKQYLILKNRLQNYYKKIFPDLALTI